MLSANNSNIFLENSSQILFEGRKNLLQRCFNNLIDNERCWHQRLLRRMASPLRHVPNQYYIRSVNLGDIGEQAQKSNMTQ